MTSSPFKPGARDLFDADALRDAYRISNMVASQCQQLADLLRSPHVTYRMIAEAIGVTPAVVRSWTFTIRSGK